MITKKSTSATMFVTRVVKFMAMITSIGSIVTRVIRSAMARSALNVSRNARQREMLHVLRPTDVISATKPNRRICGGKHMCGNRCQDFYPEGHQCYKVSEEIPQLIEEEKEGNKFICFAFECTQDAFVQCDKGFQSDIYERCMHCLTYACSSYEHIQNVSVDQRVFTVFKDTSKCTRAIQYIMRLCS